MCEQLTFAIKILSYTRIAYNGYGKKSRCIGAFEFSSKMYNQSG